MFFSATAKKAFFDNFLEKKCFLVSHDFVKIEFFKKM